MIATDSAPHPTPPPPFRPVVREPGPVELLPAVQHYAWGDPEFLPTLLGQPNPARQPWAELWMGAHPDAPSLVVHDRGSIPLSEWIALDPQPVLHPEVAQRFESSLPFLFKILGIASPLSIQSHPDEARAQREFAAENAAGLPLDHPTRNYRDPHHKPELVVALTEFHGLCGFRPPSEIEQTFARHPEVADLVVPYQAGVESLQEFYARLMCLPAEDVDARFSGLTRRLRERHGRQPFGTDEPEFWLLEADAIHFRDGHHDRGLFSFFLLNLVHLRPGQGLFLAPGILHAYLRGAGVELMANSNNVLRGGLTTKHVDVPELMRSLSWESRAPHLVDAEPIEGTAAFAYPVPAREFELTRIDLDTDQPHLRAGEHAADILIVTESADGQPVNLHSGAETHHLRRGQVFLVPSCRAYKLSAVTPASVFRATIPLPRPDAVVADSLNFRGRRPTPLAFGTSGLRGLVTDITDLEAYVNTRGFLDYLRGIGEVRLGAPISLGGDLRPSTHGPDRSIMTAVGMAIEDSGFTVDHLGLLPTPALTAFAMSRHRPSIMVTGSHIPFDRNGIKFNKGAGEVLKADEPGILHAVRRRRLSEYGRTPEHSPFDDHGMVKPGLQRGLPPAHPYARREYLQRYLDFFPANALQGLRIVFYEHSAVGRELLVELLTALGAKVIPMGRANHFVPVDTEAITQRDLDVLQALANDARTGFGPVDAVISTDGDSDRPLIAGVDPEGRVQFYGGDLVGMVTAEFLDAQAVAIPVSATDAIDLWAAQRGVLVHRTRIGSPYVIEAMNRLAADDSLRIAGWEANGGFLLGTDFERWGRVLRPLPTRDAALPILAALTASRERGLSLVDLFAQLPRRFSRAGLLDAVPPDFSREIVRRLSPDLPKVSQVDLSPRSVSLHTTQGTLTQSPPIQAVESALSHIRHWFPSSAGFGEVRQINRVDGTRVTFASGDVVHIRPSGNAPQLRVYSVASHESRAVEIIDWTMRKLSDALHSASSATPEIGRPASASSGIRANIQLASALTARGHSPAVIGTVCGSRTARDFWQAGLDAARERFGARLAASFHEDLPTNQAFGILLLWQRLKPLLQPHENALIAFVFGDGSRSSPITEVDNGQKPAIATFVRAPGKPGRDARYLTMVELALHHFVPVQQFLARSGFEGLVVKWGDEVQIPSRDLSGSDPLFASADIVRFVSLREMTDDEARNKDWVGVDPQGRITAFIPRRPLAEMEPLADRGWIQRRDGSLFGGVNLGSIAISNALLDSLLEEFQCDVNDPTASRKERPALDPEFFTALAIAAHPSSEERAAAWDQAVRECPDVRALAAHFPDLLLRLRRLIERQEQRSGRPLKLVAMDFGDQYWGDIGQHPKMFEFYMALNDPGPLGEVARALAGIPESRDAQGNYLVDSTVSPSIRIRNSVVLGARLTGSGTVEDAVLVGSRLHDVQVHSGFDVLSTAGHLRVDPRGGTYKVVSAEPVHAAAGERLTTVFLPDTGPTLFRVHESTDLRNKGATYDVPVLGNPCSFRDAHQVMASAPVEPLRVLRETAESRVAALWSPGGE